MAVSASGYLPVIVVDDGSTDGGAETIPVSPRIRIIRHPENRGKGAALLTGFAEAAASGYRLAVTMDADGQHDPSDIPALAEAGRRKNGPRMALGRRRGMEKRSAGARGIPWTSRFGREFSNFWVRASGGPAVSDTQTGFRVYPLPEILRLDIRARRYQFEVEAPVKAARAGIPVSECPVGVVYDPPGGRVSHFHPFRDFMRNSTVFCRLIRERLYYPAPVLRRRAWKDAP
ncbi:MAG: glycosyl transferase [Desulfobacterales bacterium]|nr:MAG: glycosyl transferase [Desulfobacterales bacterium]